MQSVHKDSADILNMLTIDVEEWYQTVLFETSGYNNGEFTDLPKSILKILSLLQQYCVKATFFISGSLASRYPDIIKIISMKGHEIASHGYLHRLVCRLSEEEFFDDTKKSLDILNKLSLNKIIGYRAPTWSITKMTPWAIKILKSFGLRYDSSIYPIGLSLFKSHQIFPYEIRKNFIEVPPSVFNLCGYNLPFAGGTFLRFFPLSFIKSKIVGINKIRHPAIVYFHSWEFEDIVPHANIKKWKYWIQYGNVKSVREKINLLLQNFKFSSIKEVLQLE